MLVAQNCDLHRVATRQHTEQTFGCWMPAVVSPTALRTYLGVSIIDTTGLEAAFNATMILLNREAFGGRLQPVPTWIEPVRRRTQAHSMC